MSNKSIVIGYGATSEHDLELVIRFQLTEVFGDCATLRTVMTEEEYSCIQAVIKRMLGQYADDLHARLVQFFPVPRPLVS